MDFRVVGVCIDSTEEHWLSLTLCIVFYLFAGIVAGVLPMVCIVSSNWAKKLVKHDSGLRAEMTGLQAKDDTG